MKVFNMFITAVCFIFLIKLQWTKTKSLYDIAGVSLVSVVAKLNKKSPRAGILKMLCRRAVISKNMS